jgi:hypothetical protein
MRAFRPLFFEVERIFTMSLLKEFVAGFILFELPMLLAFIQYIGG